MFVKMDLKFLILIATLAVLSDAVVRFPMYVKKLKKADKVFLSTSTPQISAYKDYALMIDATISDPNDKTGASYKLVLDSTSDFTWVVSKDYKGKYGKIMKDNQEVLKSQISGTGDVVTKGQIEGKVCSGCKISIPDTTFQTDQYKLIAADYIDAELLNKLPPESAGVLGMKDTNLFSPILKPETYVSLFINPWNLEESSFFIGIPSKYQLYPHNDLRPLTSSSKSAYIIDLQYIRSTEGEWKMWCVGGADAVLDTTYSGISGPAKDIDSINQFIGTDEDGYIDCERVIFLQPIAFYIGGDSYNLEPRNYIKKGERKFDRRCKSVFEKENTYNDAWRLGLAFMKQYLTIFQENQDNPVVSFSQLDINNIKADLKYPVY